MDPLHLFPWRSASIRQQFTRPGRRTASALALAAMLAGAAPAVLPTPAQAQLPSVLRMGQESDSVVILQRQLIDLGYLDASLATGYYGELTEAAVREFQAEQGLFSDGVVGSQTLAALGLSGQGGDLPQELNRREIGVLQSHLIALGHNPGAVDGVVGPQTEAAIEAFQRRNELRISRSADATTLEQVTRVYERQRRLGSISPNRTLELDLPAATPGTQEARVTIPRTAVSRQAEFDVFDFEADRFSARENQRRPEFRDDRDRFGAVSRSSSFDDTPYVIAVPGDSWQVLRDVKEYVPDAFRTENRRGAYIQAGAFATRADAEAEERYLRARGLDARVIFEQ